MPKTKRDLDNEIRKLDDEKFHLPDAWLVASGLPYNSATYANAEKATASRRREILDLLKALRQERKDVIAARRQAREAKAAANKRTRETARAAKTSPCQVCERFQCVDGSGRLVHHGYLRPGDGQILGDCYGVHALPYPATDALIRYGNAIEMHLVVTLGAINHLPERTEIYQDWARRLVKKDTAPAYLWEQALRGLAATLESSKRMDETELARVTARIAKAVTA